jgi:hypothetical protein
MEKTDLPPVPQLDLSKIKNLGAIKDDNFVKQVTESRRNKYRYGDPELIQLPSRGKVYKTDDPDVKKGMIKLFPMTLKEEEILATTRFLKAGSATRMVLENCIASEISARDILIFDSNYLLFKLRQISYGNEYKFSIKCNNPVCEHEFEHTVNISELAFEELPENFNEPIEVLLPKSKFTVISILPRLSHSEELTINSGSRKKTTSDSDRKFLDNLMVTTVAIYDKEKKEIPQAHWEDFYNSLIGMDAAELREKTAFSTGVDKLKGVVCPYCNSEYNGTIPVGAEFFRF